MPLVRRTHYKTEGWMRSDVMRDGGTDGRYGPFWIVTTLIFVTAAGGSAVDALDHDSDKPWVYDVGEVRLPVSPACLTTLTCS